MAKPGDDPDPDSRRTTYTRESNSTGWFVGIIVALALLAIGYLLFSANSGPAEVVAEVTPVPFFDPVGKTIVGTQSTALVLQSEDGSCHALSRTVASEMWYAQAVDCPTPSATVPTAD